MMKFLNLVTALEQAPQNSEFLVFWQDVDEQESFSFDQFRGHARGQAQWLAAHGIGKGDHVIVVMPQSACAVEVFVGAMMLGAIPSFLAYPNFKFEATKYRSGLRGLVANLKARVVIIDAEFPEDLLGHVSCAGGELLFATRRSCDEDLPPVEILPTDLAFVQHSAGTTGLQKGVALSHEKVLLQIQQLSQALGINQQDTIYSWLPLYHDMGLIACLLLPMVCHLKLVMQDPLEWVMRPVNMLEAITEHRCTLAWQPNFAFQFLARRTPKALRGQYDLSSMRGLVNCSEPVRAESMDEFREAFTECGLPPNALLSSYAMAENVFAVTQSDLRLPHGPTRIWVDRQRLRRDHQAVLAVPQSPKAVCLVSSGKPLPGVNIRLEDDKGGELGPGQVGEILLHTETLFSGYCNRPDLTEAAMKDGYYRTGDLGLLWKDELYVVGRKKDLLIVGGENLYPQDIEEIVSGHPAVHDGRVVAFGLLNPSLGTEDILVVAELQSADLMASNAQLEQDIRSMVVSGMGVALRYVVLKPPHWIVKSTAGKPARDATRAKLFQQHPEFKAED